MNIRDHQGHLLDQQNVLDLLHLRYTVQRHRSIPGSIIDLGERVVETGLNFRFDRSVMVTKIPGYHYRMGGAAGPLGHIIDHWFPDGWSTTGQATISGISHFRGEPKGSTQRLYLMQPTAKTQSILEQTLGQRFLFVMNSLYLDCYGDSIGMYGTYRPFSHGWPMATKLIAREFDLVSPTAESRGNNHRMQVRRSRDFVVSH